MSQRSNAELVESPRKLLVPRLLAFDPTPAGLVGGRSLRLSFKHFWKLIRARHFEENSANCMLCLTSAPIPGIDAHEVYSFPSRSVVRLERILFVCKHCHDTIHLERTKARGSLEYIRFLEEHYCRINGVSDADRISDYKQTIQLGLAIREYYGGADAEPALDFGPYQSEIDALLEGRKRKTLDEDDDDSDFEMYPDHECPWDVGRGD